MAFIHSFANEWRLLNRFWAPCSVQMHVLPPLISKCTIYRHSIRSQAVPENERAPHCPSSRIAHRTTPPITQHCSRSSLGKRSKKRRCALQHISDSRRVAQNVGTLDSKSQFAAARACACADTAAKCLSSKSSVPRRAAVPPQPCTPWRLAWYAG